MAEILVAMLAEDSLVRYGKDGQSIVGGRIVFKECVKHRKERIYFRRFLDGSIVL